MFARQKEKLCTYVCFTKTRGFTALNYQLTQPLQYAYKVFDSVGCMKWLLSAWFLFEGA
jgi:hypothetical protein